MRKREHHAFTLVELLVVIGIIALLISILLPALNRARERVRTVACQSNVKQVGLAIIQYADANKQVLPPGYLSATGETFASSLVRTNLIQAPNSSIAGANSVLRCHSGEEVFTEWSFPKTGGFRWVDAATNANYMGYWGSKETETPSLRTWYATSSGNQSYLPFRWVKAGDDAATLMAPHKKSRITTRSWEVVMAFDGVWANQFYNSAPVSARHAPFNSDGRNGACNMVFFDGHAQTMDTRPLDYSAGGPQYLAGMTETMIFSLQQIGL